MNSRTMRTLLLLLVVAILVLAVGAGTASAKSLTLKVGQDPMWGLLYSPHCNGGYAQIWGPNGYYRSCNWAAMSWAYTQTRFFGDAPGGSYHVKYVFYSGWDGGGVRDDYFAINWWEGGRTSSVTSP